ncbi:MAG TPA: protease pro-enzyme activation domain-containing protein, partial [Steroidobacteraceae bacterium]|nr:protease pro-enzyme activation domain-containing protein [Steroidobacteraceae bacterium]
MKFTRTSAAVFAMLAISSIVTSLTQAASTSRVTLQGSAPPWANNRNLLGATDPGTDIGFRVYLVWKDPAGAEALARAVSDPSSSSYGRYLTPTQFRARFAPDANSVAQLQQWLRSQGFSVQYTPQNNHYVSAEGTVAQAQAAFGTSFGNYLVQGQTLRSPTADISVPSSFASIV